LTEAIQSAVGNGPTSLMDSFEKHVGGTPHEGSADTVSAAWVDMVAALEEARMDSVLRAWAVAVAAEHSEPVSEPTDDMRTALREVIGLCRESQRRGLSVVHTWSL
jgi:hypothetical protein